MKSNKIIVAIISRHAVPNYGSLLQAYALQTAINEIGAESFYIDAEYCYYSTRKIASVAMRTSKYKDIPFLSILSYLTKIRRYGRAIPLFRKYQEKWLKLSEKRYYKEEELLHDYPEADIYLVGSDQVWNIMPNGEICNSYFFEGVSSNSKKVAYAASFGSRKKIESYLPSIRIMLSKFDYISVREDDGVEILKELGLNAIQVLDPTLLLQRNQWEKIIEKPQKHNKNFLLLYQVNRNREICELAEIIAKEMGCDIVRITNDLSEKYWGKGFKYLPSPAEFIWYFQNSDYIITDSFHGTCFSIIFEKQFVDVLPELYSERITSVLKLVKLENRIYTEKSGVNDIVKALNSPIDWNKSSCILSEEQQRCKTILSNMIFGLY